jgi:sugar phosphate isomerase/epimerase
MHIVHLKDLSMDGSKQCFAEVGEGNLEWEPILAVCKRAQIEWYLIEQDTCPGDPFASLGLSLRNLRAMGLD